MAEIPDQDQALNFSVKTILFDAENKDSRRKNTLDLALHCLSLVSQCDNTCNAGFLIVI